MSFIVGIDGPAGSGKGTVTKEISKRLGLTNIDTGSTYRCVALEAINRGLDVSNKSEIIKVAKEIKIKIENEKNEDKVYLNGIDVSARIREKDVTSIVSPISSITEVRYIMVDLQRKLAEGKDVIIEGRDICTYVFPNANVKIYLDASEEERAKRRFKEMKEKGMDVSYKEVLDNIQKRDANDKSKEIGALKLAKDSIIVDTTGLSVNSVVEKIIEIIEKKRK